MTDTPGNYVDAGGKAVAVNDTETGVEFSDAEPDNHSARHENGGADPIANLGGNVSFLDRSSWNLILSVDQSILIGDPKKVELDTVLYDNRGEFDSDNNRIVVDDPGFYWLSASLHYEVVNDQDRISARIGKNGMNWIGGYIFCASGNRRSTVNVTVGVYLNAGDILEIYAQNGDNDDTVAAVNDLTFFSGCKIA